MLYDDLKGWKGGQSGRDVQEGGDICILMANSHHCTAVLCLVTQSCPTLCDPMDYSLPGSSVQDILQARILERADISISRGSSQPRDQIQVSHIAGRFFTIWATRPEIQLKLTQHCKASILYKKEIEKIRVLCQHGFEEFRGSLYHLVSLIFYNIEIDALYLISV